MRHPGADTHVPRIDNEQIRKYQLDGAPASGQGATVSQQITKSNENGAIVQADADDTPECKQHTTHYDYQCAKCYAEREAYEKGKLAT